MCQPNSNTLVCLWWQAREVDSSCSRLSVRLLHTRFCVPVSEVLLPQETKVWRSNPVKYSTWRWTGGRETTSKLETLLPSSYANAMLIIIHPHVHDCSLASQLILHVTTLSFFIFFLQPWRRYLFSSPGAAVYLHTWFWCVLSGQTQRASDDVSLLHK